MVVVRGSCKKIWQDPLARSSRRSVILSEILGLERPFESDFVKMCLYESVGRMLLGVFCARFC